MAREATILISDTHTNSTLALAKPGVCLDDGTPYQLNTIQRWLLPVWEQCLDDIETLTKGYHRNVLLNGDIVDVDAKDRTWQMITKNPAMAKRHACEVLEPVVDMSDTLFVMRGTEAHTGTDAYLEEEIAENFDAERNPDTGQYSWWHLRAKFSGVTFDVAHHYGMGRLAHTYANSANKLAFNTMWHYIDWGEKPPDLVIRAHNHRFADSGRTYDTRAIFCPAWQYHTPYLYRLGAANDRPHIGALVFLCEDDGSYKFHDLLYRAKRSKPWRRQSSLMSKLQKKT